MSDRFGPQPSRKDPSDWGAAHFSHSRPVDENLLSSVASLSALNPSYRTLIGVLDGMGHSAPNASLTRLWEWFATAPHHREVARFPSDRELQDLATRLDARITLFREGRETHVVYTFQIQPLDSNYRGMVFSFSSRTELLSPTPRPSSSELSIQALPSLAPEMQILAFREALRLLGVTRAGQVEREGPVSFGRPSADTGLDRINFMRRSVGYLADLGEQFRLGQMTQCIMCEGIGKSDFEYVLKLGSREFQREMLQRLWDRWLVARPHVAEEALVPTDRELRSAARQVSGQVGLMRESTAAGVTYGLQTVLLSDTLNGLRLMVTNAGRGGAFEWGDGLGLGDAGPERMLMRVLGAPGILPSCRARVMSRVLRGIAPGFRPGAEERLPPVLDLGPSPILRAQNVRLFLSRNDEGR